MPIADGRFSVEVNSGGEFGVQAFDGQARWLQIEVCDDSTCASTTILGPRQPITAAPYALGPWRLSGGDLSFASGRVGIGTASPIDALHVNGVMRWGGATSNNVYSGVDGSGMFVEHKGTAIANSRVRIQSSRNGDQLNYSQFNIDPALGASLLGSGTGSGSLGLGTQTPTARLDVRGSIKLGASGEFFAPAAATDNLIVRGLVQSDGLAFAGTGYACTRTGTGVYFIDFTPNFSALPSVVATCQGTLDRVAIISSQAAGAVTIRIVSGTGTAVDCPFHFIAIGPR